MSTTAWVVRFFLAFAVAAAVLALVHLAKGASLTSAAAFAAAWGALSALVFTGVGYLKYKRNPACMIKPTSEK